MELRSGHNGVEWERAWGMSEAGGGTRCYPLWNELMCPFISLDLRQLKTWHWCPQAPQVGLN